MAAYPPLGVALIVVSVIFPLLAITAVGCRLWVRRFTNTKLNWSDYVILFTLLTAILNAIACIIGAVACGIGLPLGDLSAYMEVRFLKILFVTQFFYIFSVWSVKISVLLFYKSVFQTPNFKRAVNVTLAVLIAWIIAFFFVTLFQDNPIPRNWDEVEGTTINWRIFYIAEIATDVFLDIFILCLPLTVIHRLFVNRKKKYMLAGIFWLGGIVCIASIVRLYYMVVVMQEFETMDDDFSFTTVETIIWGSIEPCLSVVGACLPILSPLMFKQRREMMLNKPSGAYGYASRPLRSGTGGALSPISRSRNQTDSRDYPEKDERGIMTSISVSHTYDVESGRVCTCHHPE